MIVNTIDTLLQQQSDAGAGGYLSREYSRQIVKHLTPILETTGRRGSPDQTGNDW